MATTTPAPINCANSANANTTFCVEQAQRNLDIAFATSLLVNAVLFIVFGTLFLIFYHVRARHAVLHAWEGSVFFVDCWTCRFEAVSACTSSTQTYRSRRAACSAGRAPRWPCPMPSWRSNVVSMRSSTCACSRYAGDGHEVARVTERLRSRSTCSFCRSRTASTAGSS